MSGIVSQIVYGLTVCSIASLYSHHIKENIQSRYQTITWNYFLQILNDLASLNLKMFFMEINIFWKLIQDWINIHQWMQSLRLKYKNNKGCLN